MFVQIIQSVIWVQTLGCVDLPYAFAIPLDVMKKHLDLLNTTTTNKGKTYWHVHLIDTEKGIHLVLPNSGHVSIEEYRVSIGTKT